MSREQITIAALSLGILLSTDWAFKAYLDSRRTLKIEEIKKDEYKKTLETIQAVATEGNENNQLILEALRQNGELGKKALEVVEKTNDALVKAAAQTDETIINDVPLNQSQARSLQASARVRGEEANLILSVRIVDINTQDPIAISMTARDVETENDYKLNFAKGIASDDERRAFFKALETREPLIIALKAKLRGELLDRSNSEKYSAKIKSKRIADFGHYQGKGKAARRPFLQDA